MRTINRPPASVGIPDVDYKYFNHYNWKGLNTNKNYYDLDPETFESAENVYVDEKGILKSRPSLHPLDKNLTNIIKSWSFGHVQVYLTDKEIDDEENYFYKLHFLNNSNYNILDVTTVNVLLTQNKNNIFVFDAVDLHCYSILDNKFVNSDDFKYIPMTKTVFNGIEDESESANLLYNVERHRYAYGPDSVVDFAKLNTYEVHLETDTYTAKFDKFNENIGKMTVVSKYNDLMNFEATDNYDCYSDNVADELKLYPPHRPLVSMSDNGTYLFCSHINNDGYLFRYDFSIYYSLDGINLISLGIIQDCLSEPVISKNGMYACAIKTDGVYFLSIFTETDGKKKYPDWTRVENDYWDTHSITKETDDDYSINIIVSGSFLTDKDYVLCYGDELNASVNSTYLSANKFIVLCSNDGVYTDIFEQSVVIEPARPKVTTFKFSDNQMYYSINYVVMDSILNKLKQITQIRTTTTRYALPVSAVSFFNAGSDISESGCGMIILSDNYCDVYINEKLYKSIRFTTINISPYHFYGYKYGFVYLTTDNETYYVDNVFKHTSVDKYQLYNIENGTKYLIGFADYFAYVENDTLYDNRLLNDIYFDKIIRRNTTDFKINNLEFANTYYASFNNNLYISEAKYDDNDNLQFYFPKDNIEKFNDNITAIKMLSNSQVAIFLPNEIWYTEITENGTTLNKSKITLGCNIGDEVISSFDGKYTIFSSKRGLVALSYQDFVASTDQTITYLSDAILSEFVKFRNNAAVKMFLYKYWLFCYHNTDGQVYILDFRNNSWWYWQLPSAVLDITEINDEPELIVDGKCYGFDHNSENYFDYILENKMPINWHLTSQKLNLGTLNNYKHIINLTLNAIQESDDPMYLTLSLANYRDTATKIDGKVLEYQVDVLKTFVKRLNYYKVNHFQYKLENTNNIALQIPLSIDNVSIKYKVTGQVR